MKVENASKCIERPSRPALSTERQEATKLTRKEAKSGIIEQQEAVASSINGRNDGLDPGDNLGVVSPASVRKSDLEKNLASLTAATSTGGQKYV